MKIRILGQSALKQLMIDEPKKHDVLHYTNSGDPPTREVIEHSKSWHHIPADDLDNYNFKNYIPPTAKDVAGALAWSFGKDELIVACHAGISRSSSTAYLIASRAMGATAALDILEKGYHWPNRLIVYMGSKILKNDKIWEEFVNWQKTHNYMDPSQNNAWPSKELREQIYWP